MRSPCAAAPVRVMPETPILGPVTPPFCGQVRIVTGDRRFEAGERPSTGAKSFTWASWFDNVDLSECDQQGPKSYVTL